LPLQTKIQYKNYEPGEFSDKKERTFDETIQFIEAFPWEEQRDHLQVSLTNPSVSIENKAGGFLKLALFYHGKFVLHYYDVKKQLYTKSLDRCQDAFPFIRSFYDQPDFDPVGLRHENTWLQNTTIHFKEQDFHYSLRIRKNVISMLSIAAAFLLFPVIFAMMLFGIHHTTGGPVIVLTMIPIVGICLFIYLARVFLNHYTAAKGKLLILSRGKELFFYGAEDSPEQFDKKDIRDVVTYGRRARYGYSRLTRVEINFKNNSSINISCLIIRQEDLALKFPDNSCRIIKKLLPLIPPSAGVAS